MVQRHVHDDTARPWPGAGNVESPVFVPLELRAACDTVPAAVDQKLRRELYGTREMVRAVGNRVHTIAPSSNPDDLEVAVKWRRIDWAAREVAGRKVEAERSAHDTRHYTCQVCGRVVTPALDRRHTLRRTLADGHQINACAECFAVADTLATAALAAETIGGVSRADRARRLLDKAKP